MGNIVLLDDLTINKIAAGEVIERPASVVKEMMENSIDAGAKNITVEVKNGGISLIKITDDGCGIAEDDLEIAFERHATSKIRTADDLITVKSMGFRGEALASIASIARVELVSKKENTDVAHKIVVEGGKTLECVEAARSVGTTITVENLFYNTPVRYKFLKKDYTEAGYIEDVVTRAALVNPNIAFKLISNGKTIVQTNGNGDLKSVIYSIYGKDTATETVEVDYQYEEIRVKGVVGKPVIARGNRVNQLFFLNGRYIKDKNLTAAADQSFKGIIPVGRYGFIVLDLIMDPKMADVNVHPAKLEVRFTDESKVFKAVYHAIRNALSSSELVETVEKEESTEVNKTEIKNQEVIEPKQETKKSKFGGLFSKILGEPDETEEELNENRLEDVFKYRQKLKEEKEAFSHVEPVEQGHIQKENQIVESEVKETEEVGTEENENAVVESANSIEESEKVEMVKEKKVAVDLDAGFEDIQKAFSDMFMLKKSKNEDTTAETPTESTVKNDISSPFINENEIDKSAKIGNTIVSSNTREIDVNTVNTLIKDATQIMASTKMDNAQATQIIDSKEVAVAKNDVEIQSEVVNIVTPVQNVDDTNTINEKEMLENGFASIAEKLVEARLGLDSTQMIDTNKVREAMRHQVDESEPNPEFDQMYQKTFGVETVSTRKIKEQKEQAEQDERRKLSATEEFIVAEDNVNIFEDSEEVIPEIPYKFIGIVFSTYIIVEIQNEMYIIDQHAAHERINYEKIRANYYNDESREGQFLLLPDVITLTHKEMNIARENTEMFERAGFSFEEFGENTIKLNSVPGFCEDMNTKQLFLDILDEIGTVAITARQEKEDKFLSTIACKASIKGNMRLDEQEVQSLMAEYLSLPNPFSCPHGRPTAIKMTKNDLEKKFSRRK